ncbi:MAG: hypothetical protein LQ338_002187 [Usnochroma carphineum]|nr:MAG: hypothetical protein LQ338_002187 [Usnochroma carphineum]
MPLHLSPAQPPDFPALIACQKTSYLSPKNTLYTLFCPMNRPTAADSLAEATERQLQWHEADPSSVWLKVTDPDTKDEEHGGDKIVGGACWHVYEKEAPFRGDEGEKGEEKMTCYWWPEEGRKREMADQVLGQLMGTRAERMVRPCLLLEICYVHPSYRRQGAGNMLVQWGTQKADELGLEAFVESTADGKPLYAKHGFHCTNEILLKGELDDMDEGLKRLQEELTWRAYYMWRPKGGKWVEGETVVPWVR